MCFHVLKTTYIHHWSSPYGIWKSFLGLWQVFYANQYLANKIKHSSKKKIRNSKKV